MDYVASLIVTTLSKINQGMVKPNIEVTVQSIPSKQDKIVFLEGLKSEVENQIRNYNVMKRKMTKLEEQQSLKAMISNYQRAINIINTLLNQTKK